MNINRRLVGYGKLISLILLGFVTLLALYFFKHNILPNLFSAKAIAAIKDIPGLTAFYSSGNKLVREVILNPYFYLMVGIIFTLEKIIPADRQQKVFSAGMWQDFVWLIGEFIIAVVIIAPLLKVVGAFYLQFLSQYATNIPVNWHLPGIVTICLSILIMDFFSWVGHLILHKVPWLWNFHAVHHSQTELNLFTDTRFHFFEAFIYYPLTMLPLYLVLIPLPGGIYYLWFRIWYARLYHANIKSNFGWLRYILVTPQSHRIHHSEKEEHYDCNFGVIFSFWDRLFGTQHHNVREYPATGISDRHFPRETQAKPLALIKTYCRQTVYPFIKWR